MNEVKIQWVSVEDRKPDTVSTVLFADGDTVYAGFYAESAWFAGTQSDPTEIPGVTHWAELPRGPLAEADDD